MDALTVGQVARQLGIAPWVLSNLFYRGKLSDAKCPVVGGRRMIPPSYVASIAALLRNTPRREARD
jgi:hypothetical protein